MITKDMNLLDILRIDEGLADVLMESGMHCLGCMLSHFETLEEACAVPGIDPDAMCDALNEYLETH